jgi:hypothetical protein
MSLGKTQKLGESGPFIFETMAAGITRREAHLTGKAIYPHLCGVLIPEAPRKSFWVYQNP